MSIFNLYKFKSKDTSNIYKYIESFFTNTLLIFNE